MTDGWAVLFDLDGTLADTHDQIYECLRYTLQAHVGIRIKRELWSAWVGIPLRDLFATAFKMEDRPAPDADTERAMVETYRCRQRKLDGMVRGFPGIPEALDALRAQGLRLAIVTTKHSGGASRTLEILRLGAYFETVVTGDQFAHYKPHPAPFELAMKRLGIAAASCMAVGDSRHDIVGARAAGARTAAALWGAESREAVIAAGPDCVLQHPAELIEAVREWRC